MESKAIVVLSGGQDSTTCLFWALKRFERVQAISFDYGQRHRVELGAAQEIARIAGVEHAIIDASFINALAANALTRPDIEITAPKDQLPSTFVDGRNMFFLTMAAVYAKQREIHHLVAGTCQQDYSGYPDCRRVFIDSLETTLGLAMEYDFAIHTPLMDLTKAESVDVALSLGRACMTALTYSHTCYAGVFGGCQKCPACLLRAKGFAEAGVEDPMKVWAQGRDMTAYLDDLVVTGKLAR